MGDKILEKLSLSKIETFLFINESSIKNKPFVLKTNYNRKGRKPFKTIFICSLQKSLAKL